MMLTFFLLNIVGSRITKILAVDRNVKHSNWLVGQSYTLIEPLGTIPVSKKTLSLIETLSIHFRRLGRVTMQPFLHWLPRHCKFRYFFLFSSFFPNVTFKDFQTSPFPFPCDHNKCYYFRLILKWLQRLCIQEVDWLTWGLQPGTLEIII